MKSRKRNSKPFNATHDNEGHDGKKAAPSRKLKRGQLLPGQVKTQNNLPRSKRQPVYSGFQHGSKRTGAGTSCPHN